MAAELIAIVGETASGKTALAIELAQKFDGEIICADSRTVYKGLDVSTAKPTPSEQRAVKHHLLDVVNPDESFNVADFKRLSEAAIKDIHKRGKLPILVGGTGLYVDSVLYDFQFSSSEMKRDEQNPRHLAAGTTSAKSKLRENTLILGLQNNRDDLDRKIHSRVEHMVNDGLLDEIKTITQNYGWEQESLQTPAFKGFRAYLEGKESLETAIERMFTLDRQLAKRQRTWFKRNPDIHWIERSEQAFELVQNLLNKKQ